MYACMLRRFDVSLSFQVRIESIGNDQVNDHVCKLFNQITLERIKRIPSTPSGADWRDLPNIEVELDNGTAPL